MRFPTLTAKEMVRAIKKMGFVEVRQKGSHLSMGKKETGSIVIIPMHSGDLKRGIMKSIIKQTGLSESEFRKLL